MRTLSTRETAVRAAAAVGAVAMAVAMATAVGGGASGAAVQSRHRTAANPYHLIHPGTLTVGMDLAFKPEMYLNKQGRPAGYDVALLDRLAHTMHVKLSISNLGFTGLIPGLEAKKFDLVSVGLSPTPVREKSVSFSRAYVPYELVLAAPVTSKVPATIPAWNKATITITALEGSTDTQLAKKLFPKAKVVGYSGDTAALLQVATHRASAVMIESYLLGEFQKSNPRKLKEVPFKKPLTIQYGSYAVQKGNGALVRYLNKWICGVQKSGWMASAFERTESAPLPPMPRCP
ncbi:MAG: transporter substrate-binding domain-containing protein [Actinomycetota bacterium]|nr:transporter substrate-binding domain-containing protein [Actinomycetota bacterium]